VFKQGMLTTGIGLVLGLTGALIGAGVLESRLFGVQTRDVPVFAGVTVLLLLVSMAACYVPARRATRVEPIEALRDS
jgi:putative ABC transport system permease protein